MKVCMFILQQSEITQVTHRICQKAPSNNKFLCGHDFLLDDTGQGDKKMLVWFTWNRWFVVIYGFQMPCIQTEHQSTYILLYYQISQKLYTQN